MHVAFGEGLAHSFCIHRMLPMSLLGFSFRERMEGTVQRRGEPFDRRFWFDLDVRAPSLLGFATTAVGRCEGTLHVDGLARDVPALGRMEISPLHRKLVRYVVDFRGDDGRTYRFDGQKDVTFRRHLVGWTTLPGHVYDADEQVWGDALLRFSLRRELRPLLRSFAVGARALPAT